MKIFYICDGKACDYHCLSECHHTTNINHAVCPNGLYILSDSGEALIQRTVQDVREEYDETTV